LRCANNNVRGRLTHRLSPLGHRHGRGDAARLCRALRAAGGLLLRSSPQIPGQIDQIVGSAAQDGLQHVER
jgi:hypothetical protein